MTAERPSLAVISAIGLGQILSCGSSYHLPAVLAVPIAEDTGWSLGWLFGALSIGRVASGLVSPRVVKLLLVLPQLPVALRTRQDSRAVDSSRVH